MATLALALTALAAAQAQTPSLLPNHDAYFPGEDMVFSFKDGPGNPKDWIGLYPEGIVPGDVASTRWFYVDNTQGGTKGLREGAVTFAGGLNLAGTWTAFLLLNDGYTVLAQTNFTVMDPFTPALRASQRVYAPGEAIAIAFTNGPANPKDWIGIYQAGQTPGGPTSTLWAYVDGTQNGAIGLGDGTVAFATGLAAAGNYVAFLLENDGYTVLAQETFSVMAPSGAGPRLLSVQPANQTGNHPPIVTYLASITNSTSQLVPASVGLSLNGAAVTPAVVTQSGLVTIAYTNATLLPPASTNTFRLVFADNATPANRVTNEVTFAVAHYRNLVLPAPLYFENFDATPEGALPAGWSQVSFTEAQNPEIDLGNLDSAAYARWTVVNADRFQGSFVTYSNPDNPQGWEDDYRRVLSVNPLNVVNGQVLRTPLATGRFAFANSGYRNGASQVDYLFTPDFNLAGQTNVHLSFHSLWEQNQDSLAAIEYSIDQGATWLPIAYFLDGPDVLTQTNEVTGEVQVDAVATLTTERGDVARYFDPNTGEEKGGTYGAFIGAAVSQALAPFIQRRVNDDPVESKRVELFRLAAADNQAKVRFRFAHAGTDSWYFGIDDFGLYSIGSTSAPPPSLAVTRTGNSVVVSWPAGVTGFVLESSPTLAPATWTAVTGVTGDSVTVTPSGSAAFYRLRQ